MKMLVALIFGIGMFIWFSRKISREWPGTSWMIRYAVAFFAMALFQLGAMKQSSFTDIGNEILLLIGGGKLPSNLLTTQNGGNGLLDSDEDGMPDIWEISVFLDPFDASDAESRRYDSSMDALAKYEIRADHRVVDTAGDGVGDWYKREYSLFPVSADIGELIATNGITFHDSYIRGLNPLVKTQNPQNLPLTDAELVALGYDPFDYIPNATNRFAGDITIIRLGMTGAGVPYSQIRVGHVIHTGREARNYAIRSGFGYTVEIERLPGMTGGAGLPVLVTLDPVDGIIAELPDFTGHFTVPESSGSILLPMSAPQGGVMPLSTTSGPPQNIEAWHVDLSAENDHCIHGSLKVTASVSSSVWPVVKAGNLSWSWVANKNYGVLPSPSTSRAITITIDEDAHDNWHDYKVVQAKGAGARQTLRCDFEIALNDPLVARIRGTAWSEINLGCCLAHDGEQDDGEPNLEYTNCVCGQADHCYWCENCCFPLPPGGGTLVTNSITGTGFSVCGLRLNNNWNLSDMSGSTPIEDRYASKLLMQWGVIPIDPDYHRDRLFDLPQSDCCVCRKHGDNWAGQLTFKADKVALWDLFFSPISVGSAYMSGNAPKVAYFEGVQPGGWNGSQYIAKRTERLGEPNSIFIYTNFYVIARHQLWPDFLRNGDVLSDANRLQSQKQTPAQTVEILEGSTEAAGLGTWADNHHGGRAWQH